eukprot:COSAG05_NODE_798_length_7245_cov_46.630982_2_plen_87_part_00
MLTSPHRIARRTLATRSCRVVQEVGGACCATKKPVQAGPGRTSSSELLAAVMAVSYMVRLYVVLDLVQGEPDISDAYRTGGAFPKN